MGILLIYDMHVHNNINPITYNLIIATWVLSGWIIIAPFMLNIVFSKCECLTNRSMQILVADDIKNNHDVFAQSLNGVNASNSMEYGKFRLQSQ